VIPDIDLNIHPELPKRRDFRIGVAGSGFIVSDCHLPAYWKAGFQPVAIASRNRVNAERVAERFGIPTVHDDYEALLSDPEIEVLDIAVPPDVTVDLILKACEKGTLKGILAQKPLGVNFHEAKLAVEACEAAGIVLSVNQNMRYDQSVRAGKSLLESGRLGEPVVASIDMRGIPHWMPWQERQGWVTLRIMSIHHIDCFRYWLGDPKGIFATCRPDPRTRFPHRDGICNYQLIYPEGPICTALDDTWTGPAREGAPGDIRIEWRLEGTDGLAMGDIGWCREPFTTPSRIRYALKGDSGFTEPTCEESWFPDAFAGTMAQLLVALEKNETPAISGRDNLKTMALVDAAYRSIEERRIIDLEEILNT